MPARPPLSLLAGSLLGLFLAAAQAFGQPPAAADFAWLTGDWVGEMGGGVIEETWSPPAAGTLVGMFRWSSEEGVRLYELMSIEDTAGGPVLYLRHFSPGLVGWEDKDTPMVFELDAFGERRASFLSTTDEQTTRLTFSRKAAGLEVELEQIEGAERSEMTFNYEPRG